MGFYFLGKGDSEKAAKEQAKAILDSAAAAARDSMYQAQAANNQMVAANAQRIAAADAADLLGKPMESATVDLAAAEDEGDGSLITKRRTTRQRYQAAPTGGSGLVV